MGHTIIVSDKDFFAMVNDTIQFGKGGINDEYTTQMDKFGYEDGIPKDNLMIKLSKDYDEN